MLYSDIYDYMLLITKITSLFILQSYTSLVYNQHERAYNMYHLISVIVITYWKYISDCWFNYITVSSLVSSPGIPAFFLSLCSGRFAPKTNCKQYLAVSVLLVTDFRFYFGLTDSPLQVERYYKKYFPSATVVKLEKFTPLKQWRSYKLTFFPVISSFP